MDCLSKPELLRKGFVTCVPGQGPIREGAVKGIHKGIFSFCIYSQDVIPGNEIKEYQRPSTNPVDPDMILYLFPGSILYGLLSSKLTEKSVFKFYIWMQHSVSGKVPPPGNLINLKTSLTRHMHNLQGLDHGCAHSHNNVLVTW